MNLADHLRPLLRDHDCVIIPDFGGLVAEYAPAQVRPGGRHLLVPPTRQVAFNQALTRNDGLLVDALRQHLHLPAAEAREAVRQAVAQLHQQLRAGQRTELPGIGVFRQLPGRGLQFEYTGTECLLPAAFGLPELAAHPVRVLDARLAREQQAQLVPRLRTASQGVRWRRLVPASAVGLLAGVAVAALYLLGLHPQAAPVALRPYLHRFDSAVARPVPQQATLGQPSFAVAGPVVRPAAVAPVVQPAPAPGATASIPTVAVPAAPKQTSQTAPGARPAAPNAAEALLDGRLSVAPRKLKTKGKVPATAAVALASADNVAHPVPLAARHGNTPGLTTTYPVAPASARLPLAKPLLIAAAPLPATSRPAGAATAPAATAPKPVAVVARPVAMAAKPMAVVAKVPAAAADGSTINHRTGRFYIVVGAFSNLANAQKGRATLAHTGRPAKIILPFPGTRKYRLSAGDFADKASANVVAARLRQNPNFAQGVTVYPY